VSKLDAGSVQLSALKIPEKVFKMDIKKLREIISENGFVPIAGRPIDESFGFVDPIENYESENFNNMTIGSYQVFALRRDFYDYSQERILIEYHQYVNQLGRKDDYISKIEKNDIREMIITKMRSESTPKTSIVHFFFDYTTSKAYVLGKGDRLLGKVLGILEKSFGETFINHDPSYLIGQYESCTGRGFLTWLYRQLINSSSFDIPGDTSFQMVVESKICMKEDSGEEIAVTGDTADEHHVTREILNKKTNSIDQMNLRLTYGSLEWIFTLKEGYLFPEGVRLPFSGSQDDLIDDRLGYIGQLDIYMTALVLQYIEVTRGEDKDDA